MAISAGLTSAITNPLHQEVRTAVMAADVMMANDPECARWIRAHRTAPPGRGGSARRGGRRRRRGDDAPMAKPAQPQIIFTPSGRRGRVPEGTTVLEAAA